MRMLGRSSTERGLPLMRLDLKDTGWCVLITWIVVTAANYAAYRAEGLIRDTWV